MKKSSRRWWQLPLARAVALVATLAALASGGAAAQEVLAQGSYLIERIVVEGSERFAPEILVAESLLEEGEIYTERQLRDAAHRIVRLPLVLDASFALRKGEARDRYVLVITVEEVAAWFVGLDSESDAGDQPEFLAGIDFIDEDTDRSLFVGRRVSAGRHGIFSMAADPFDGGKVQVGYTHFDFLGRSIRLNANYLLEPLDALDTRRAQSAKLIVGIPLQGNHSLSWSTSYRQTDLLFEVSAAFDFDQRLERFIHNLSWVYNSLDDPVFPTSGRFVKAGGEFRELTSRFAFTSFDVEGNVIRVDLKDRSDQRRLLVTADQYWATTDRTSWSASVELAVGSADNVFPTLDFATDGELGLADVDLRQGSIGVGHQLFLLRDIAPPRWRELRWENRLELFDDELSPTGINPAVDLAPLLTSRRGVRLTTRLRYRSRWGVLGLSLTYREVEGDLQ